VLPFKDSMSPYFGIELCLVNVSADAARSAQCIALTGSRTVPQAFLNKEHIGNERTCTVFDKCGELGRKLRALAAVPSAAFPPEPEAAFVKLTDDLAISSQPTLAQVRGLGKFGFRAVVNLVHERERGFLHHERVVAQAAHVRYVHAPPSAPPRIPISHIEVDILPGRPMPGAAADCSGPTCPVAGRDTRAEALATCSTRAAAPAGRQSASSACGKDGQAAARIRRGRLARRLSADDADSALGSGVCPAGAGLLGSGRCDERASSLACGSRDEAGPMGDVALTEVGGGASSGGGRSAAPAPGRSISMEGVGPSGLLGSVTSPPPGLAGGGAAAAASGEGGGGGTGSGLGTIEEEEVAAANRGVTVEDWGEDDMPGVRQQLPRRRRSVSLAGEPTRCAPKAAEESGACGRRAGSASVCAPARRPLAPAVAAAASSPEADGRAGQPAPVVVGSGGDDSGGGDASPGDSPAPLGLGAAAPHPMLLHSHRGAHHGAASDAGASGSSSVDPSTVWTMRPDDLAGRPALYAPPRSGPSSTSSASADDTRASAVPRTLLHGMAGPPSVAATLESPMLGPRASADAAIPPPVEDGPVWTVEWCESVLAAIEAAPKPVLVHCQTGVAACTVGLVRAARQLKARPKQVARWAADLGHRISEHGDLEHCVAALLAAPE